MGEDWRVNLIIGTICLNYASFSFKALKVLCSDSVYDKRQIDYIWSLHLWQYIMVIKLAVQKPLAMLHTTYIPYGEFERVLGITGIDEYIRYGGTMSLGGTHYNAESTFKTKKSTDEYIDSAIARNIQHSLKYYQYGSHFRALAELYDKNELTSVINRVVEDINHRFTIDVLTADFKSHDLGISRKNHRKDRDNPTDVLDNIDIDTFTTGMKIALDILNL